MENGERKSGFTYSLSLLLGFLGVVVLGLLGLPMTMIILLAFAAAVGGAFLYGLRDVLAYRRPRRSVLPRQRRRPRGRTLEPARRSAL